MYTVLQLVIVYRVRLRQINVMSVEDSIEKCLAYSTEAGTTKVPVGLL